MRVFVLCWIVLVTMAFSVQECSAEYCGEGRYRSYGDIVATLNDLARSSDGFARVFGMGNTDGREGAHEIAAILITKSAGSIAPGSTSGRPTIIITGAIHGNEWIGAEVAIGIAEFLIDFRNNNEAILISNNTIATRLTELATASSVQPSIPARTSVPNLLANAEILIVPVLNPDGYEHSMTEPGPVTEGSEEIGSSYDAYHKKYHLDYIDEVDGEAVCYEVPGWDYGECPKYRDWRKNRKDVSKVKGNEYSVDGDNESDVGVNLNRNFDYHFGVVEHEGRPLRNSKDPTDYRSYHGDSPASESEVRLLVEQYRTRDVVAAIDYHAAGALALHPFAFADVISEWEDLLRPHTETDDGKTFLEIGIRVAGEIGKYYGVSNRYTSPDGVTYNASGASRDWAYDKHNVGAINIEIGALKSDGVLMSNADLQTSPARIQSICKENIPGAVWLMFWAADQGFRSRPKLNPMAAGLSK